MKMTVQVAVLSWHRFMALDCTVAMIAAH